MTLHDKFTFSTCYSRYLAERNPPAAGHPQSWEIWEARDVNKQDSHSPWTEASIQRCLTEGTWRDVEQVVPDSFKMRVAGTTGRADVLYQVVKGESYRVSWDADEDGPGDSVTYPADMAEGFLADGTWIIQPEEPVVPVTDAVQEAYGLKVGDTVKIDSEGHCYNLYEDFAVRHNLVGWREEACPGVGEQGKITLIAPHTAGRADWYLFVVEIGGYPYIVGKEGLKIAPANLGKFAVGDKVVVTNNGATYSTYREWVERNGLSGYVRGESPENGAVGIVRAIAAHNERSPDNEEPLVGISVGYQSYVIGERGLDFYVEPSAEEQAEELQEQLVQAANEVCEALARMLSIKDKLQAL